MSFRIETSYVSFTAKNTKQSQTLVFTNTIDVISSRIYQREIVRIANEHNGERKYDVFLGTEASDSFNLTEILDQFPVTVKEEDFDQNDEQTITGFSLTGQAGDGNSLRLMPVLEDSQQRVYDMFILEPSGGSAITADLFIKRINQEFTVNDLSNTLVTIAAANDFIGYDVVTRFRNGKTIGYDIFVLFEQQT